MKFLIPPLPIAIFSVGEGGQMASFLYGRKRQEEIKVSAPYRQKFTALGLLTGYRTGLRFRLGCENARMGGT